jgi:large subunit ribosomal protein L22
MRRFQARGRGRSARVEKWFSHLRIVVTELPEITETSAAQIEEGTA